jgi:CBS domain-containing protein
MEVMRPRGSYLTPSFEHATVADAMRPRVLTCDPATPLVTVAQEMATEHVHSIVVLGEGDGDRRPWGVVTDRDVLRAAAQVEELTAGEVMGGEMLDAFPGERLADVADRMAARGASHVLVVDDRHGLPVGVLSTLDIAGILAWGRA